MENRLDEARGPSSRKTGFSRILGELLMPVSAAIADAVRERLENQDRGLPEHPPLSREQLLLEQWKLASELHRHQDNLIWQQFNYFVGINLALFPILGALVSLLFRITPSLALLLGALWCFLGVYVAHVWRRIQARQYLYQSYRVRYASVIEDALRVDVKGSKERVLTLYQYRADDPNQTVIPQCEISKDAKVRISHLLSHFATTMAVIWMVVGSLLLCLSVYLMVVFRLV